MSTKNLSLENRLNGMLDQLNSSFKASTPMSASAKVFERELFISGLLSQVFPPHYRFGSGDITDHTGSLSGQIDIVFEYPIGFSFPVFPNGPRLYLAESVASAIEVKSDVRSQWNKILHKGEKISKVTRRFTHHRMLELAQDVENGKSDFPVEDSPEETANRLRRMADYFGKSSERIPFFVVGFLGWSDPEKIIKKIGDAPIDGIFLVEPKIFVSNDEHTIGANSLIMFLERLERELLNKADRLKVLNNYFDA